MGVVTQESGGKELLFFVRSFIVDIHIAESIFYYLLLIKRCFEFHVNPNQTESAKSRQQHQNTLRN